MKGLNKAYLIGVVAGTPELLIEQGVTTVRFSLGTPATQRIGDEYVETTDWHRLVARGPTAQYLATHATAGTGLAVEVTIRPQKDGVVDLLVERVLWLSNKRRGIMTPWRQYQRIETAALDDHDRTIETRWRNYESTRGATEWALYLAAQTKASRTYAERVDAAWRTCQRALRVRR